MVESVVREGTVAVSPAGTLSLTAVASQTRATATFNGDLLVAPATMTGTIGYGNLYGGYTLTDKPMTGYTSGWQARIAPQASLVNSLGVGLFVALELHEENDMHMQFMAALTALNADWAMAEGDGGNHLLYRKSLYSATAVSMSMGGGRQMSDFTVTHLASGVSFHLIGAHFRADDTAASGGKSRAAERLQQASFIAQYSVQFDRVIVAADMNSSTQTGSYPRPTLAAAGLRGLQATSETGVANGDHASYSGAVGGAWIEDILTRPETRVTAATMVPTNGLSDHYGWLTASVQMTATVDSQTRFTLYRTEAGGIRVPVPGWQDVLARTSVMTDNSVPLNRPVTYVVVLSNGEEYAAPPITVQAPLPLLTHPVSGDVAECWVETWPEFTYEATTTLVKVPGRRSPVVITSGEQLPTSEPHLITRTEEQRAALESLAVPGEVLLLRTTDARMPDAYVTITARSTERILEFKLASLTRRHRLSVQEIAPEDMTERAVGNTLGDIAKVVPGGSLGDLATRFPGGTLLDVASADWKALA